MNQNHVDKLFKGINKVYLFSIFMFLYPIVLTVPYLISLIIIVVRPDDETSYRTFWYIISYFWSIGLFALIAGWLFYSKPTNDENDKKHVFCLLVLGGLALIAPIIGECILNYNSSYLLYGLVIFFFGPVPFSLYVSCYIILKKDFVLENNKEIFVSVIMFILRNFTLVKSIASILQIK